MVDTSDEIYGYVNDGTPPHPIPKVPKISGSLAFQWGGKGSYKAKTAPRVIGSTGGGPTGPMVFPKQVQHPGTKARNFDDEIQKKWTPKFKRHMEKAMRDAARASGHAIE